MPTIRHKDLPVAKDAPDITILLRAVRGLLSYDAATGAFAWRVARRGRAKAGACAGTLNRDGYRVIRLMGRRYMAHRLAWLHEHGRWPLDQIDHINGVRDDNRIANLREATNAQNQQNAATRRNNSSGHTGVSWDKSTAKWCAAITLNRRVMHIGLYERLEDASAAYRFAKEKFHTFSPEIRAAA